MPRTNKKTRIKGLPPRLQLQQKDATTGSFPSKFRSATDNRTGQFGINYNDLNTIGFGSTSNLLEDTISYWRFNSGSTGEVEQTQIGPPTSSFNIKPVFVRNDIRTLTNNRLLFYTTTVDTISTKDSVIGYWAYDSEDLVSTGSQRMSFKPRLLQVAEDNGFASEDLELVLTGSGFANISSALSNDTPFTDSNQSVSFETVNFGSPNHRYLVMEAKAGSPEDLFAVSSSIQEITVAAWVKITSSGDGVNIMRKAHGGSKADLEEPSDWGFDIDQLSLGGDLKFRLQNIRSDGTLDGRLIFSSDDAMPSGSWIHVAATYNGSGSGPGDAVKLYLNGSKISGSQVTSGFGFISDNGGPLVLGIGEGSNLSSDSALIDEPVVFTRRLLDSEIEELYNFNKTLDSVTTGGFKSNRPFSGSSDDLNRTAIEFNDGNLTVASGSLALFNPGSDTAVSGASEKSFSISFWMDRDSSVPSIQSIISVAQPSAVSQPLGVTTGSILNVEKTTSGNSLRTILVDPNNNGIGKSTNIPIPDGWTHVGITYDGSKTFDGINLFLNGTRVTDTTNLFQGTNGAYIGMTSSINDHNLYIGRLANDTSVSYDGFLDELTFFDRVLFDSEMLELSRFERSLNKPEKNPFTGIYYGLGLPANSRFIKVPTEQTTSLFGAGRVTKGIGDSAASFTPGQDLTPYRDHDNPAVNAISSDDEFFATGSLVENIGPGFDQPLWSKTKIEIDLTPSVQHSFGVRASGSLTDPAQQDSHFMAYWNHEAKIWQGIGNGAPLNKYEGHSQEAVPRKLFNMFSEVPNGFGSSVDSGGFSTALTASSTVVGNPINNFGFPFDARYKATSSNFINVSDFIDEPFLVEKIVLQVSATLDFRDSGDPFNGTARFTQPAITSFFLLNQRNAPPPSTKTTIFWASGSSEVKTLVTESLTGNSSRDLLSWVQISKRVGAGPDSYGEGFVREANYNSINSQVHFNQQFSITSSVKTPIQYEKGFNNINDVPDISPDRKAGQYFETWNQSGRNGTGDFGRNYLNAFITPSIFGLVTFGGSDRWINETIATNTTYEKINPYLLLPGDKLILGWNLPSGQRAFIRRPNGSIGQYMLGQIETSANQLGPQLTFGPSGTHKLIIYGSKIRNQREFHDTLNQLLTSEAVHEVIE